MVSKQFCASKRIHDPHEDCIGIRGARTFFVDRRDHDLHLPGLGLIAEGTQFSDGTIVMHWLDTSGKTKAYADLSVALRYLPDDVEIIPAGELQ